MAKAKPENDKVSLKPTKAPPPLVRDSRDREPLQADPDHILSVVGIHSTFLLIMGPLSEDPEEQPAVLYNLSGRSFSDIKPARYFSRFIKFREPGEFERDRLPEVPDEVRSALLAN